MHTSTASHPLPTITFETARERIARGESLPGSLDGWTVSCPCGEKAGFAFESMAREHARSHHAYMASRGR